MLKKTYWTSIFRGFFVYTIKKVKKSTINGHFSIWMIMSAPWDQSFSIFSELVLKYLKKYSEILTGHIFLVSLKITSQILEKTKLHFLRILYYTPLRILGKFFLHLTTDYRCPVDKSPSLHGQKSTPTPKILYTAKAYFVCHIGPNFQFSLIYAFIGFPYSVI